MWIDSKRFEEMAYDGFGLVAAWLVRNGHETFAKNLDERSEELSSQYDAELRRSVFRRKPPLAVREKAAKLQDDICAGAPDADEVGVNRHSISHYTGTHPSTRGRRTGLEESPRRVRYHSSSSPS